MDLTGVEAFLAIVQTRNMTKAAELLHVSQSTVSYRLQTLEREIGAILLERGKGVQTVRLTPAGEGFVALAQRWSLLKQEIEALQMRGPEISLVIGVADSQNIYVLPPLYRAFRRECPNVRLRIVSQHTEESYASLERREIDVAFVKTERVSPNITAEPYYVDEMVLVRLAGEGRETGAVIPPQELDCRNQLYFNWGPSYQIWHDRWWDTTRQPGIQVDAAALIFSLMDQGEQWAVVPESIAKALAMPGRFVIERLTEPPPTRVCYMVMPKYPDPRKASFLEIISRLVREGFSS